jgi:ribosomal protein S18 acetylase RimI-like enzyme
MLAIRRARVADVDRLAPLFDAYRQFYQRPSDLALARRFLGERLQREESIILLAETPAGVVCGFTQLYPLYSSLAGRRSWYLSDLFVDPAARRSGVGRRLLEAAHDLARETQASSVELDTAHTNQASQSLYESLGYRLDTEFRHYVLKL